jgi:hypothetical protein
MMATTAQIDAKPILPVGAIGAYLAYMVLLVLFQTFWEHVASGKDIDLLNLFVPILFGIANLLLAWQLVRQSPMAIWNPLFWLLLACTLYYGLGQLIHLLGHPDSVARVNTLYFVDAPGLARTNFLNTVGVMIIVGTYLAAMLVFKRKQQPAVSGLADPAWEELSTREARYAAMLFLFIGLPVKYFLQLPYDLGLLSWVLPGSIKYLGMLSGVAIIPLYWLHKKRGGVYRVVFLALVISESLASLVSLSKQRMIETALFMILGSQLVKPSIKKLGINGLLVTVAFIFVVNPFVTFARVAADRNWASAKDLSQAFDLVEKYTQQKENVRDVQFPNAQLWWNRLAYSNVELFAMRQYDRGHPGTTFQLAPYTLIPRFIMPEKPWMNSGLEFTYLITGDRTMLSATGLGVIGEGYWNGGWLGVGIVSIVLGTMLAGLTVFSLRAMTTRAFLLLPIPLAGIMLGLRIDDWFVPTYIGTVLQLLLMYGVLRFVIYPILSGHADVAHAAPTDHVKRPDKPHRRYAVIE